MDVTDKLMKEHQLILKYIDLIQFMVRIKEHQQRNEFISTHGKLLIDFIQNYADRYHHAKEENVLFRMMESPGVLTHCNPLPQMLYEHQQGRECVVGMIESLKKKNFELFCENASAYGILLNQHIFKEDRVLYPMAEEGLSPADKKIILDEYDATEQKLNAEYNLNDFYEQRLAELKRLLGR